MAKKIKEILVETQNKMGMLAEISSLIANSGANITAVCAYAEGAKAHFMIVTTDNQKALVALKEKGYKTQEQDVVEVQLENKVGVLKDTSKKLADANVDINYIYGTVGQGKAPATLIISSNNNAKLIDLLK